MTAPRRKSLTIATYSRIAIWLALLFIASGYALQSVQINLLTQSDVDSAFSEAVASQAALALKTRLDDTQRLQLASSSHEATLDALLTGNRTWLSDLKHLLPGTEDIRLLTPTQSQNLQTEFSFAVQDLVNRTLRGDKMKLEAVNINGEQSFFWASPVPATGTPQGVLLVRYGQDWLNAFRSSVSGDLGQIQVMQKLTPQERTGIEVFRAGKSPVKSTSPVTLPINDYWFLTYTPSDHRPVVSLLDLSYPWLLSLLLTLSALFAILFIQKRALHKNRSHFQQFLQRFFKQEINSNPGFSLKLFNELADDVLLASEPLIDRLNSAETSAKTATLTVNPKARQRDDLPELDEGDEMGDEAENADNAEPRNASRTESTTGSVREQSATYDGTPLDFPQNDDELPAHIFRAYDIRGIVEKELTDDTVRNIGKALGSEVKARGFERINLAWDGRLSSPSLAKLLQEGLLSAGCSVNRLGQLPTGALYYACFESDTPCGVMITGSHNPAEYNGFKAVIDQQPLSEEEIQALAQRIRESDYTHGYAGVREDDISQNYLSRIGNDVQIGRDMHIVIDAGNGVAGPLAAELFRELGAEVTELYCDVDGRFPNHHPDPGEPENLEDLKHSVLLHNADLGFAFDGDGDRILMIDNEGNTIWPDRMMMLLLEDILPRRPGSDVLFDVKSTRHLAPMINRLGGRPTMWKTGHSLMKRKLKETGAAIGGEFSGHFYIAERWYGFDDGLYVGARLLEILSNRQDSVADVCRALPEDISTPELTVTISETDKFTLIDALCSDEALTSEGRIFTTDGLRIEFSDGWGLIRASNTTPKLTLRFAGDSDETVTRIQTIMKQALTRHAPEIQLPF